MATNLYTGRTQARKSFFMLIVCIILLLACGVAAFIYLERESPLIALSEDIKLIGSYKELSLTVTDRKSGISNVNVILVQGGKEKRIGSKDFQREGYNPKAGPETVELPIVIDSKALNLKNGEANLVVSAKDFSYWMIEKGGRIYE